MGTICIPNSNNGVNLGLGALDQTRKREASVHPGSQYEANVKRSKFAEVDDESLHPSKAANKDMAKTAMSRTIMPLIPEWLDSSKSDGQNLKGPDNAVGIVPGGRNRCVPLVPVPSTCSR